MDDIRSTGHTVPVSCRENLRANAESTMRSVHRPGSWKQPFRHGKIPFRGKPRVRMVIIASAAMTNVRRFHKHLVKFRDEDRKTGTIRKQMEEALKYAFVSFFMDSFNADYHDGVIRKYHSWLPQPELFQRSHPIESLL